MTFGYREIVLIVIIAVSFVWMMSLDSIAQSQAYHNFADQRSILSIPNFLDVASNLPFFIFGILGLIYSLKNKQAVAPWSWVIFFFGVSLVCFGSGYYHWNPNNDTLFWDRLPMTIGFMGLFIGILSECVSPEIERRLLIPAVALGFSSVVVWAYTDDLRFYYWIQLIPLFTIPLALILFKGAYTLQRFLVYALVFYILAKQAEIYDRDIFDLGGGIISGHSLKHILASLATLSLYLMLKRRRFFKRAM